MIFPNNRARIAVLALLTAIFVLGAVACSSNGSGSGGNSPTATPTDIVVVVQTETPVPTATPTRTPAPSMPEPVEITFVAADHFGEPVAGSVYEDLLAHLPDNETTRSYTKLMDYGGMLDLLGLDRFPLGATDEQIEEHALEIFQSQMGGLQIGLPEWPADVHKSSEKPNWYPFVGFDFVNVEQSAFANGDFVPKDNPKRQSRTYDVAFGLFDPGRTEASLANCGCDQPTIRLHEGVEYYAWDEEGSTLRRRWAPPLYDHLGRGPRVLVEDGIAYWTSRNPSMEDLIDVRTGQISSLAHSEAHVNAVRKILSLGQMRDITIRADHLSVDDQSDNGSNDFPEYPNVARKVPLLEEFLLAAEGVGFDGERAFTGLVIAHADDASAERNADLLAERIRGMRRQVQDPQDLWGDFIERVEIAVDGSDLLVRIYYRAPELHSYNFPILQHETLVAHE